MGLLGNKSWDRAVRLAHSEERLLSLLSTTPDHAPVVVDERAYLEEKRAEAEKDPEATRLLPKARRYVNWKKKREELIQKRTIIYGSTEAVAHLDMELNGISCNEPNPFGDEEIQASWKTVRKAIAAQGDPKVAAALWLILTDIKVSVLDLELPSFEDEEG